MRHNAALQVAGALAEHLRPVCTRIEIKGSIARLKNEPGDIEILAVPDPSPVPRAKLEFGKPIPRTYHTMLDKAIDEMKKDGAIDLFADGQRHKKFWLKYAGIKVDLFICIPPSDWGVQAVIRTGPKEFGHWCVTNWKYDGALPDEYFVKHQVVWIESEISKQKVSENPDYAIGVLTDTNHLSIPEEIDFLKFLDLGWIEPKDRVARWQK